MRIWIINHYALPPTSAGGTRHYQFAHHLKNRGHDVVIVAANYNHFTQEYLLPVKTPGQYDTTYEVPFQWIPVPSYRGNTIARFWNMLVFSYKILRKKYLSRKDKPDVIIGSSPHLFAAFSAKLLAKHLKIPFILEVRDLWPETLVDLGRISKHHPLIKTMKWIELYLYKHSESIITLLPKANEYLIECGVDPAKIFWLPNFVDTEMVNKILDNEKVLSKKPFTFIYAGTHGLANDLETVIHAAKILEAQGLKDKIKIQFIGDGPDKLRLKNLANTKNISMIDFISPVPKNQIYSLLNQGDAFLMLLKKSPVFRWGISPNKLFDYLMLARPVIFSVETSFNPIKEYNAGISIQPSHPELLANAMRQLSTLSKKELTDMGQRGKEYIMKHHNIVHLTSSLENLINSVCNRKA